MPAPRLLLEQTIFSHNFIQHLSVLLCWQSDRGKEVCDDVEQFVFGKVALTLQVEMPGDLFEQLPFVFWLKLAAAANLATGVPLGEQGLDTLPVEFCTAIRQVELILVDNDNQGEQERISCQRLNAWIALQAGVEVSCIDSFLWIGMAGKPAIDKLRDVFRSKI